MPITTASSIKDLPEAVRELKQQCGTMQPRLVLLFSSSKYDGGEISRQVQQAFPDACLAGCSTAGEIAGGRMLNGSVTAMFLDGAVVEDAACAVVENLSGDAGVREAFAGFERHFQMPVSSLDIDKYVGLVLADGLSGAEERLMEKIGDRTDIFFVGGSAGDDLKFQNTQVFLQGKAYTNAAVLVLLHLKRGFEIVKTQSFRSTGKTLKATRVEEASRKVIEFNHQPALPAYAEAVGVPPEDLTGLFMRHPLGLMVDGEPFVRSPQRVDGQSVVFYCQIKEGMELDVLEATDIVADTRKAVESRKSLDGPIAGIIDFQCILRALELRAEKRTEQYGAIFSGIPSAGFSTYGEAYLGHMNQTSTMLLFR
jgi:hypothetical protein